ncbi:amino acid ABC transporter ATP-binding protein [Gephyromycinifex aptenodytis]|uniref:amino acid ABC transporter ATP-binding protein n=1 Tax=Gephyromycinifex aptenodytis TaxID=2716227 RepID=UPI0029CA1A39|nr:amino acid ABC transporter ATP-binding protein [Gephyromycinifex aptenodytis]
MTSQDIEAVAASGPARQAEGPLLSLQGVRCSFDEHVVLHDIDLDVAAGECVVLIGRSGSGKSTLLRCINLLEQVDDGIITLQGEEITDPRARVDDVRSKIGLVFQAYNLFPHLSVLDNVTLAPRRVHGVPAATARKRAMEMLDRVGLADKAHARPDELSGGQQQRAAIARALVNDPVLMLLDEVTSALDPELVGEVLDLLRELSAEGMTMILSTHEMSFARQVANTVAYLDGGVIVESGPPQQIFDAPRTEATRQFLSRL